VRYTTRTPVEAIGASGSEYFVLIKSLSAPKWPSVVEWVFPWPFYDTIVTAMLVRQATDFGKGAYGATSALYHVCGTVAVDKTKPGHVVVSFPKIDGPAWQPRGYDGQDSVLYLTVKRHTGSLE